MDGKEEMEALKQEALVSELKETPPTDQLADSHPVPPAREPSSKELKEILPVLCQKFMPLFALTSNEINELADAIGNLIDKWFPDEGVKGFLKWIDVWMPEVTCAWVVYKIFSSPARLKLMGVKVTLVERPLDAQG